MNRKRFQSVLTFHPFRCVETKQQLLTAALKSAQRQTASHAAGKRFVYAALVAVLSEQEVIFT